MVDQAEMLSAAARGALNAELAAHEQATGQQVVVVTLQSLDGLPIRTYGYQLGRHWAIGRKDHDDGVLLLVAQAERQIGIEVGYGLEGTLTDALAWDIIQSRMMPLFRRGEFEAGIIAGARAIVAALGGKPDAAPDPKPPRQSLGALLFWIVVVFILLNGLGGGRRRRHRAILIGGAAAGRRGGFRNGGFGSGGFGGGGGSFGGGGASGGW